MKFVDRFDFPTWNLIAWCVCAAVLLTLEFIGVARHQDATLTYFIRNTIPGWVRAMIWGWLGWHFLFGPMPK